MWGIVFLVIFIIVIISFLIWYFMKPVPIDDNDNDLPLLAKIQGTWKDQSGILYNIKNTFIYSDSIMLYGIKSYNENTLLFNPLTPGSQAYYVSDLSTVDQLILYKQATDIIGINELWTRPP